MKKAIIGAVVGTWALAALVAIGMVAMVTVDAVSAQGRVDTPCAGYTVDVRQEADGYDMLLTVPLPPEGFQGVYLEVEGQSLISPEGDGNNVFRIPFTVFDIGAEHHYYASSWTRGAGGLMVYACTDIGTFAVKL